MTELLTNEVLDGIMRKAGLDPSSEADRRTLLDALRRSLPDSLSAALAEVKAKSKQTGQENNQAPAQRPGDPSNPLPTDLSDLWKLIRERRAQAASEQAQPEDEGSAQQGPLPNDLSDLIRMFRSRPKGKGRPRPANETQVPEENNGPLSNDLDEIWKRARARK